MNKVFILLLLPSLSFASGSKPNDGTYTSTQANLKVFKKAGDSTYYSHIAGGSHYHNKSNSLVKLGYRKKMAKSHKLGFSVRNEQGQRHSDDWIKYSKGWKWDNTSYRSEQILAIDYTYSKRPFTAPLLISVKQELDKNFLNQNERYIFSPSLSYFFFGKRGPYLSIHYSAPFYYAFNFEEKKFYKRGQYIAFLYYLSKKYQLGINYRQRKERWTTESEDFRDLKPNDEYDVEDTINTLGFELIIRL